MGQPRGEGSLRIRTPSVHRKPLRRVPDALIAASALHHGLALVTQDCKDFERVPGLGRYPPPASSEHSPGAG